MRAVVFDEAPELAHRAHVVLGPVGFQVTAVRAVDELVAVLGAGGQAALLIAKLTGDTTGWELARVVRETAFTGTLLVLVDHLAHPGATHLTHVPRALCVVRPPSTAALDALLRRVGRGELNRESRPLPTFYGMVGQSKQMLQLFPRIDKIAATDANVCIYGESGTGKELASRAIHYASPRRDKPFITLDCTAIPEGLLESHLFGHVKGAFTGAIDQREGVFSLANLGTLFIDELSDLGLPLQAKLLRVIQTREFSKIGGTKPILTNIRLITAMNADPKRAVEEGTFREDLYYRVAVVMLRMPPLRERKEDIPLLVEHFLRRFSVAYHKSVWAVSPKALDRMMQLNWPGNVRQLANFVEQAFVLAEGDVLSERDLFLEEHPLPTAPSVLSLDRHPSAVNVPRTLRIIEGPGAPPAPGHRPSVEPRREPLGDGVDPAGYFKPGLPLREVERRHILRTLQAVHGKRAEAAKSLGISIRALQYKLKFYLKANDPTALDAGSSSAPRSGSLGRA